MLGMCRGNKVYLLVVTILGLLSYIITYRVVAGFDCTYCPRWSDAVEVLSLTDPSLAAAAVEWSAKRRVDR